MSYILEALRRSQAERERGQVPGLHAQPLAGDAAVSPRSDAVVHGRLLALVLSAAALLLLVFGAWWWLARGATHTLAGSPQPARPANASAGPELAAESPAAVGSSPPPVPTPVPPPGPTPALTPPLPIVVSAPPPPPVTTRAAPTAPTPAAGPVAGAAVAADARTLKFSDLTPAQRRELPALVFSGSIFSDHAPSRFVMINGRVVREGELVAPELVLERIGPRSALLRWRGQRLEVPL